MSPISFGPAPRRTIVVHDRVDVPLAPGDYEVRAHQTVAGDPKLGTVPDDVRHVRVTGPRYRLPAPEILSTFPPANADGPFVTRLAQVALRRRTLPWERADGPARPWLAVVLLTDGEGAYLPSVPVAEAVTPGVRLEGPNPDGPECACIEVTRRVVRQVFPSRQELPFTCHVREVPLDDTELAEGDDDGWVAVVLGTRLPRPGMRYRACLVSLEGQWSALPDNPATDNGFTKGRVYDVSDATIHAARRMRSDGAPVEVRAGGATSTGHRAADAWTAAGGGTPVAGPGGAIAGTIAGIKGSVILDVDLHVLDPDAELLRFPVLASWEFRCEGDKDFARLVQELDVGMLGTVPPLRDPAARLPEVSATGHVVLDATERTGEPARAWYRGPLVPRAVVRREPAAVHVADQLRRVAEDGRVELGEAAAFELGRLLALSSPSTVAALREWRRQGFARRRAAKVGAGSLLGDLLGDWPEAAVRGIARALGGELLTLVAGPDVVDGVLPARPLVDPLPELDLLADPPRAVASGLGLPVRDVRASFTGVARPALAADALVPVADMGFDAVRGDPQLAAPVRDRLAGEVAEIAGLASGLEPHGGDAGAAPRAGETVEELFGGGAEGDGS